MFSHRRRHLLDWTGWAWSSWAHANSAVVHLNVVTSDHVSCPPLTVGPASQGGPGACPLLLLTADCQGGSSLTCYLLSEVIVLISSRSLQTQFILVTAFWYFKATTALWLWMPKAERSPPSVSWSQGLFLPISQLPSLGSRTPWVWAGIHWPSDAPSTSTRALNCSGWWVRVLHICTLPSSSSCPALCPCLPAPKTPSPWRN